MVTPPQMQETSELHKDAFSRRFASGDNALRASILEQRALYEEQLNTVNRSFSIQSSKLFVVLSAIGLAVSAAFGQFRQ
jgi:hypothetical protein